MKKIFILFIAATISLASCSKEEILDNLDHQEITSNTDLRGTWITKHATLSNVIVDGEKIQDVAVTLIEANIKDDTELRLNSNNNCDYSYSDYTFGGNWYKSKDDNSKYELNLIPDGNTYPISRNGELVINYGRLYLIFTDFKFKFEGLKSEATVGKLKLELIRKD